MTDTKMALFGDTGKVAMKSSKAMAAALKGASEEASISQLPDGGVYISFSGKMGTYSIGQDKEDANYDELWLMNVYSFEKGFICWKGGSPVAKRLGSIYGDPISTPDFQEHGPFNESRGEGWNAAVAGMFRSIDRGIQGYFSTNTKSAMGEWAKLQEEVARRIEEGEASWPLVQLGKEKFTAQGQVNSKPKFDVYGWLGDTQIAKMSEMESADEINDAIDQLIAEAEAEVRSDVDDTTGVDDADTDTDGVGDPAATDDVVEDVVAEPVEEPVARPRRRSPAAADAEPATAPRRRRAGV